MHEQSSQHDKRLELLAAAALGELSGQELVELGATDALPADERAELESLELAAAELAATVSASAMPARVRASLDRLADSWARGGTPVVSEEDEGEAPAPIPFVAWAGWLAAAAAIVVLAAVMWPRVAPAPSMFEQRMAMLGEAGTVRWDWGEWALGGEGPDIEGVSGDVVWSEAQQTGFIRFVGLPANDPEVLQYQLWIVDERGLVDPNGQSARISGAIFDSGGGEVIVKIEPAIPVQGALAFAVTIEEPGGVWASTMERRVVIAARPG